jgi:predicted nucleic acid-binding protein
MSRAVFADTFYFLSLLDSTDAAHRRAVAASLVPDRSFVTAEFVLLELGDALARPRDRPGFLAVQRAVRHDRNFLVVPVSGELLRQGLTLYEARMDKEWSLTDCISFVVMRDEHLTEALTGDRHFEQAGFKASLAQG